MKLQIPTKDLREALHKLANIPGAHGSSLFTQVVRFEAGFSGLELSRFTSEARITITLDGASIEDEESGLGTPMVGHERINELVGRMRDKEVTLSTEESIMHFKGDRFASKLPLIGEEGEATPSPADDEFETVEMPVEELISLLKFAGTAMSKDEAVDPHFCGVCLRSMDGKLAFIATDKKRCHVGLTEYEVEADCIIASQAVQVILRALASEAGQCSLMIGANCVAVRCGNADMQFALLAQKFPDISAFLKQEAGTKSRVKVNKSEFVELLNNIAPLSYGASKLVNLTATKSEITLLAKDKTGMEFKEWLACENTEPFKAGVAAAQTAAAVEQMSADENGMFEFSKTDFSLFLRQPDRVAIIALAKDGVADS